MKREDNDRIREHGCAGLAPSYTGIWELTVVGSRPTNVDSVPAAQDLEIYDAKLQHKETHRL